MWVRMFAPRPEGSRRTAMRQAPAPPHARADPMDPADPHRSRTPSGESPSSRSPKERAARLEELLSEFLPIRAPHREHGGPVAHFHGQITFQSFSDDGAKVWIPPTAPALLTRCSCDRGGHSLHTMAAQAEIIEYLMDEEHPSVDLEEFLEAMAYRYPNT